MKQLFLRHPVAISLSIVMVAVATTFLLVMALWQKFTDSDLVYCLSDEQRPKLVDAAVMLDLAQRGDAPGLLRVDGEEVTLEQWLETHRKEFQRGCLALDPPQPRLNPLEQMVSTESGLASGLAGVLGALVGSGILYFSERARDRAQRREDEARRLNDLSTAFTANVENFVSQRSAAIPPDQLPVNPIREHRNALISELRLVRARYPGWDGPDSALEMLDGILSDALLENWRDKHQRAEELRDASKQLAAQISSIIAELERGGPAMTRR